MASVLRLAHRGDWRRAPENSLAAMRAALANPSCDGLEFDVRASREGIPVLLHDATLDRVQRRPGRPEELSIQDLAAAGIPALADVLALAGSLARDRRGGDRAGLRNSPGGGRVDGPASAHRRAPWAPGCRSDLR